MSPSVLLIADPGAPAELAEDLSKDLPKLLTRDSSSSPAVSVQTGSYRLTEQDPLDDVLDAVDPASQRHDVVVYVTDLPRRDGTQPVVADISLEQRFGVISVPSVGGLFIGRRVRAMVESVIAEVAEGRGKDPAVPGRLNRTEADGVVRYVAPPRFARLRLLMGMIYANRPWKLTAGLSRVLMATFATGAVSLAYPTIWQLSSTMGSFRLGVTTVLATAAMVGWLIVNHKLWEKPSSPTERERAALYNASTVATLTIGVVVLHATCFVLLLLTAWWTLPPQLLEQNIGHPVGLPDFLRLAWLVAAIATLGGALGSGLEDDQAVKQAAYGARQQQRFARANWS
ncbi:hypothetical protein [Mycobacterium sp. 236(2023)]|uniref:hypothetical protein n=1 Tax=Mycobacterium sp. 236(2023) TaxID=3038163 RepID=UPI002414DB82|nr:hypothetical protein [Mycobacterium sp. 236(2023)]MDG4664391.1 hypothetical protein [Mycobacterium sp. 236(2023)]